MPLPIPSFMVRTQQRREHEAWEDARDPRRAERRRLDALMLDMYRQHRAEREARIAVVGLDRGHGSKPVLTRYTIAPMKVRAPGAV